MTDTRLSDSSPPNPCAFPGCLALVHRRERYCDRHRREKAREQWADEGPPAKRKPC